MASKQPLNEKMDRLSVPKIQRMNAAMTPVDEGDEAGYGLGYHHTLVSRIVE
jgi:hypothetical protein